MWKNNCETSVNNNLLYERTTFHFRLINIPIIFVFQHIFYLPFVLFKALFSQIQKSF